MFRKNDGAWIIEPSVFFFDFDNTLFSHLTKQVPPSALDALDQLRRQGHVIVLVSGRGRESFHTFEKELGRLPEIVCLLNGQLIYEAGFLVYENAIPAMDVQDLFQTARENGFAYGGYDWNGIVVNEVNDRVRKVWEDFHAELPEVHPDLIRDRKIFQGQLYIYQEEAGRFGSLLDGYVTNWSHECLLNLIHRQAGKSRSIRWCLDRFGIDRSRSYAFGDGYNDMDMLESVGHGIAMGDGFEPLKAAAEYVTESADHDGIALALRHYGFIE